MGLHKQLRFIFSLWIAFNVKMSATQCFSTGYCWHLGWQLLIGQDCLAPTECQSVTKSTLTHFLIPLVGCYLPWLRISHNIYMESIQIITHSHYFQFLRVLYVLLRHAYFWASPYFWTLEVQVELCVILLLAKWHCCSSSLLSTLGSNNNILESDCNRFQEICIICIRIGY